MIVVKRYFLPLNNSVAERYLTKVFARDKKDCEDFVVLKDDCMSLLTDANKYNLKKIYFRMAMLETNLKLTQMAVNALPNEYQELARLKYGRTMGLVRISMELNLSVAMINVWDKKILNSVNNALFFKLTDDDIFRRVKIINMIEIMKNLLAFFAKLDCDREIVNERWIRMIERRYNSYRALITAINNCLLNEHLDLRHMIICYKIRFPHTSVTEIADKIGVNKGVVSRYIYSFKEETQRLITL